MGDYIRFDEAALRDLFESVDGPVGKELTRRAIKVQRAAKRLAPVDTGRLRSSIAYEVGRDGSGLVARIGTNVHYAIHQEYGTRYMAAHPFLRPALAEAG